MAMLLKTFIRHSPRIIGRCFFVGGAFVLAALDYFLNVTLRRPKPLRIAKALWLQRNSRRVLRIVNLDWRASGPIPTSGLLVCNHLSYVDVLVLAAMTPAVFVAKHEVKNWPVFGWFARLAGTIFVRREKRGEVTRSTDEIKQAL